MGDERRDFDTSGRTNGQQDQTEPVPPPDETQPFAAADGTQPEHTAAPGQTQQTAAPDQTQPFAPVGEPGHTSVMPREAAWSGRAGVSPPQGPSLRDSVPYTYQIPQEEQPRPWWTPVLLGALALGLLGVLILVAWWMGRNDSPVPVDSPSPSVVVPTAPTEPTEQPPPTTQAASPTAQQVQVPRLVGLELDKAVAQLDQLGLSYRFEYRQADEPEGIVIQTSPPEGLVVPVQTTITLVISTGRDRSPTPPPSPAASASAVPG